MNQWLLRGLVFLILGGLLYWALRNAPLTEIISLLMQLTPAQVIWLLLLNIIIFLLITVRWWVILHANSPRVPFAPLVGYRLAAFGLSYFTPGPQMGGEPLQIIYLQKHYGLTFARATSAVIMDKLLEFLANFLFLAVGFFAVIQSGMLTSPASQMNLAFFPLLTLLLSPLAHILLMYFGKHPLSALLSRLLRHRTPAAEGKSLKNPRALWMNILTFIRLVVISEQLAGLFCRRHLGRLLISLTASLLVWVGMVYEYIYMLTCLRADLDFSQALASLTAARLSFLMLLPAGQGTLEASQVFAASAFGLPAALGISLSLLMRARDLLLGGMGLLIATVNK